LIFVLLGSQQNLGIVKNDTVGINLVCFNNGFGCAGLNADNEMLVLGLQVVKQCMPLVTSIAYNGLSDGGNWIDKWSFGSVAVGEINFSWNCVVQIKTQMDFSFL
jgi:hypothetical protein